MKDVGDRLGRMLPSGRLARALVVLTAALAALAAALVVLTLAGRPAPFGVAGAAVAAAAAVVAAVISAVRTGRVLQSERRQAAKRLRAFQRIAGIGMFEWDLSRPDAKISDEYRLMMGLPHGQRRMSKEEWASRVHPDDRDHAISALEKAIADDSPFDVEYRVQRPDGSVLWTGSRAVVFRDGQGRPQHVLGAMLDIDARKRAELAVLERERMFRHLADTAPVMIWVSDNVGNITFFSRSCYEYTGRSPEVALGRGWMDVIHPEDREKALGALLRGIEKRQAYSTDMRVRRHDGMYRWMISTGTPRLENGGTFVGFVGLVVDIQDRKEAEARHELLMREVDHRAKNALAVVASIIRITRADTIEAYIAAVEGRIEAMARAHSLLAASNWRGTPLRRLLEEEVMLLHPAQDRLALDGPPVMIAADGVQPLTLVLHEMATNALKHGALAGDSGRLSITWTCERGDGLQLRWQETVGRPLRPPDRRGFGLELLETLVEKQVRGTIDFRWNAEGLDMHIHIPRTLYDRQEDVAHRPPTAPEQVAPRPPVQMRAAADGQRVLVVEDDVLIALSLEEMLTDFGYTVAGPAHSVEDALRLLDAERPDAALLDMNLGGMLSTAVAARLETMGVPFAYCTGYGDRERLGERAPVLVKPFSAAVIAQAVQGLLASAATGAGKRREGGAAGRPH